jgi:hypothetical protein
VTVEEVEMHVAVACMPKPSDFILCIDWTNPIDLSASAGLLVGGTVGILRTKTPVLWAIVTSAQWGLLGGTYWGKHTHSGVAVITPNMTAGMRTGLLQTIPEEKRTPSERLKMSSLSGGASFAVIGAITREFSQSQSHCLHYRVLTTSKVEEPT